MKQFCDNKKTRLCNAGISKRVNNKEKVLNYHKY